MKSYLKVFLVTTMMSQGVSGQSEAHYQLLWCPVLLDFQEASVETPSGSYVDCLGSRYAVEVDFSDKWAECLGQALHYAAEMDRAPGCILIRKGAADRHIERFHNTAARWGLDIRLWIVQE